MGENGHDNESYIDPGSRTRRMPIPEPSFVDAPQEETGLVDDGEGGVIDAATGEAPDEPSTGEPERLDDLTRDELDERAREVGVEAPETLANKAEVIARIEEATHATS